MDIDTMDRMQDYYFQNYRMFFAFEDKPEQVTVKMIDEITREAKTETTTDPETLKSQAMRDKYMLQTAEKLGRQIWEERQARASGNARTNIPMGGDPVHIRIHPDDCPDCHEE